MSAPLSAPSRPEPGVGRPASQHPTLCGRRIPRQKTRSATAVCRARPVGAGGAASLAPQQAVPWYSRADLLAELGQEGEAPGQLGLLPPEAGAGLGAFFFVLVALLPGPLGYTLQLPTINTLITKRASRSEIGETLGVSTAFVGAGTVIGPLLGGYLFTRFAPGAPYALGALLSVCFLVVLLRLIPNPEHR